MVEKHLGKKPLSFEEWVKTIESLFGKDRPLPREEKLLEDLTYQIYLSDHYRNANLSAAQELEKALSWRNEVLGRTAISEVARKLRVSSGEGEK